jgi:integrase
MALSDVNIRKAKPADKTQRLFDGGGMYLELSPAGGKWWRLKYRFGGKEKRLSLGTYPDTGLSDARGKRDAARKLLAAGVDPGEQRKATKAAGAERSANSFEVVAREWHAKQSATWVELHASRIMLRMENDIFPWLGSRPIADITAKEFLATVNRIVERGAVESAHRVLQNCGQVMRYAIATGRAERNPVAIGGLLRAIDVYKGSFVTRCALQLAPLLFVRPGELRQAEWVEFDLDAAQWNLPAEKMKMREPHLVPLAPQAVAILRELHALTGRGRYLFPSSRSPQRPMSNNGVLSALRRMGYGTEEMSGHGFRAMARTVLDEVLHFRPDYIEHQLAHAVRDPNGRAYNRTAHIAERRKMMAAWADYLETMKVGGSVVAFARTAS